MKVTGGWLTAPGTQAVFDVYAKHGFALYAVGGCVRNSLLNERVSDVDMSSNARPELASKFLTDDGFKVIPTGIDHGTITVISDGTPYEITTFRKDVETDGRRAVVAFAETLEDDAYRRDFTINALYADRFGQIIDPVNGLEDIQRRRVRFIGDGAERIREDFLRTLRFFRFHARFAAPDQGFETDALSAISENLQGLESLSRERVGGELIKLLSVTDPTTAIMTMAQIGVLNTILPGCDPKALGLLIHFEQELGLSPEPIRRLGSFADEDLAKTLRLSKSQMRRMTSLRTAAIGTKPAAELGYRLKTEPALSVLALRSAFFETPLHSDLHGQVARGAQAVFPLKASDLPKEITGKNIGNVLRECESEWIASGFVKTKSQLLG